jgi:subtilisin-like proprotein convertase family protein
MAAEAFNGKGVRGIAPFAKIAGSNWLEYQSTVAMEKVWLTGDGANEIAVTNNSWGYGTGSSTSRNTLYENLAEQGTQMLRDGKGRIYVKSAGNDRGRGGNSNLTYVSNNRFVVAVSALKHDNTHASYSSPGGNLLISGYSGNYYSDSPTIGTTINMGKGGSQTWDEDENKNYTYKMNGTSAAGPTVAASIALVLEACPNLGWRDVKSLLAKHGKRVDSDNKSWVQNSAGLWHSSDYGYGLVNPKGMIADCNSSYINLDENKTAEVSGTVNLDLNDRQVATIGGLNISDDITIEWVELTVDSNHTRASDYRVELISPAGTTSRIVDPTNPSGAWMNNGFRFGCAGFIDEHSNGEWKVKISDFDPTDEQLSGAIKSLKVKVYGH